jgi:hypothetical protein
VHTAIWIGGVVSGQRCDCSCVDVEFATMTLGFAGQDVEGLCRLYILGAGCGRGE